MAATTPRLRFAPSPTGMLHLGNARTALFNWLFARHSGGETLLRIEDTDESRGHPDWVDLIYRSLDWLGLGWDGEPMFQSARFDAHRQTAEDFHARGLAYYCDCTREDLDARNAARGEKTPGYDGFCRDRGLPAGPGRLLRFRVPHDQPITRVDVVRGVTEIDPTTIEDFGILRGNGVPLYVFANALDDIDDGITHVLRGEDHLTNVPKQMLIRRALGLDPPVWAHLPMIVNAQRKKLSKRRDKAALASYQDEGYLPEAMANYLATLGWSPGGDDEIATLGEMVSDFTLEAVNSSPAMFDEKKLDAFNGHYIRQLTTDDLVARAKPFYDGPALAQVAEEVQTRIVRLDQIDAFVSFLDHDDITIDPESLAKVQKLGPAAAAILDDAISAYATVPWDAASLHEATRAIGEAHGLSLGKAQSPIRLAVTGHTIGLPLFESLAVLGRDRTLQRLHSLQPTLSG